MKWVCPEWYAMIVQADVSSFSSIRNIFLQLSRRWTPRPGPTKVYIHHKWLYNSSLWLHIQANRRQIALGVLYLHKFLHHPRVPHLAIHSNLPFADFNTSFNYTNTSVFFAGDISANHYTTDLPVHTVDNCFLWIQKTPRILYLIHIERKGPPSSRCGTRAALVYHTHLQRGPKLWLTPHTHYKKKSTNTKQWKMIFLV